MILSSKSIYLYGSNLLFRGLTIGSRFFFTFFLGKQFSEEVLGQYGLFATSILLVYFVISFSFDSYGLRAILQKPEREQGAYIRNHFVFYLTSYVIFVGPIALIFLTLDILPAHLLANFSTPVIAVFIRDSTKRKTIEIIRLNIICHSYFFRCCKSVA